MDKNLSSGISDTIKLTLPQILLEYQILVQFVLKSFFYIFAMLHLFYTHLFSSYIFLESRIGKIEAVVVTGGEPTLQHDLAEFLSQIKQMGFLVKLDTNGHFPNVLETTLNTVDMIALDLKATCDKYKTFGGDCERLKESLEILKHFKRDLIIRTTMYPPYTSKEDLETMDKIIPHGLRFDRQFNEYRDLVTLENYLNNQKIF